VVLAATSTLPCPAGIPVLSGCHVGRRPVGRAAHVGQVGGSLAATRL